MPGRHRYMRLSWAVFFVELNERPRETLEFETLAERLMHVLHRPVEVATHSEY